LPATGSVQPAGRVGARKAPTPGPATQGRAWLVALAVCVTILHLWLVDTAAADRFGLGSAPAALPVRMQVAFVRELAQQRPPAVAPAVVQAAPQRRPPMQRKAAVPSPAASQATSSDAGPAQEVAPVVAADPPASAVVAAVPASAPQAESIATAESGGAAPQTGAAASGALASTAESFAWPPSTRLSYTLTGNYRGPVEGQAQVEWLLDGARYQVHMELSIGPAFAPLASRRVSSEGLVSAQGLSPRRYDEVTRALFRQAQSITVWLDEDRVRLSNGRVEARPAGVQDSASQFVHLTWLFTTQPALLRAGQSVTLPLALPRSLEPWVYDVLGAQTLSTPAGEVEAFHVKPRRPARGGSELTAEIWVAPTLQYLPVRIVIRQDAETFLDLLISRLPQQAAARPSSQPAAAGP